MHLFMLADSSVKLMVIPTDEEVMIARDVASIALSKTVHA